MSSTHPLISCICIAGYESLTLQRAIVCFKRQDYPNTELVISYSEEDILTKQLLNQITKFSSIKIIQIEHIKNENPVTIKNNAINASTGDFICLWNDEHWHHVSRISDQYRAIKNGPFRSSLLMYVLLFDVKNQQSFHSGYQYWQDTILCEKQLLLQASYTDIKRKDDSSIIQFLTYHNTLYQITEAPHLYIYVHYSAKKSERNQSFNCFLGAQIVEDVNQTIKEVLNMDYYLDKDEFWDI